MPVVAFDPVHPPVAVHVVAPVDDHVNVEDWPDWIEEGDAEKVTVGAEGATALVHESFATASPPLS